MSGEVSPSLQVIKTVAVSGLDPARMVIHGGSALGIYDIRPPSDLDVLLEPTYFAEIAQAGGQTPGGMSLLKTDTVRGRKRMTTAGAYGEDTLPMDASTFTRLSGGNRRFRHTFQWADEFECALGVLKVRPLLHIQEQKRSENRGRDRIDVVLIEGFLQRSENQPVY